MDLDQITDRSPDGTTGNASLPDAPSVVIIPPSLTHGDRTILKVQHWLRTEPARDATVADMTRLSGLEERTFLRRFHKATSLTPLAYLQHLRVEKGRDLLETTSLPLDQIAWEVGYQDSGLSGKSSHDLWDSHPPIIGGDSVGKVSMINQTVRTLNLSVIGA